MYMFHKLIFTYTFRYYPGVIRGHPDGVVGLALRGWDGGQSDLRADASQGPQHVGQLLQCCSQWSRVTAVGNVRPATECLLTTLLHSAVLLTSGAPHSGLTPTQLLLLPVSHTLVLLCLHCNAQNPSQQTEHVRHGARAASAVSAPRSAARPRHRHITYSTLLRADCSPGYYCAI